MSTPRLLIIQPDESDPPGPLGDWLTAAGAELDVRRPPMDELPDGLDGYQGVVCLGGEMGAEDDAEHPWLAGIRRLLASAAGNGLPTLGICLGAQLLAVACGGMVGRGKSGPEVGPALVSKRDVAWTDPLFAELPLMQDVMQFHRDVIEQLPPSAELLASAPLYPNQAYRLGRCTYGVQFHVETTPEVVQRWLAETPDAAEYAPADAFETERLDRLHGDLADTWAPFARRFAELAAGTREPAGHRHTLPLA
ncbi:type 1 glutamine amidotransferase [Amycolatopsis cihanbeyliensis]|uniref:GMP synthase-like glutamine amidotransferase n=1 Tax=Amycolatopsis cihanbeyliensis TaxID=1128664 RepID=A0A542DPE5_AMYCI|nr:type 1 glutamine amidotransferase [Amycolatopsis cihanbeyliensis]TQJ04983.1 GMP synthase-like glutamine amidotransferase [Amycolatopsis cihanbeyliensis]